MNPTERNEVSVADAEFLRDMARYFEKYPTGGEDSAHWANVYNAQNCRRIAALLSPTDQGEAKHRAQEAAGEVWERAADAKRTVFRDVTFDWTPCERTVRLCQTTVRNRMVEQEWPPQDGDQQIDEVLEALESLLPKQPDPAEELVRKWRASYDCEDYQMQRSDYADDRATQSMNGEAALIRWLIKSGLVSKEKLA